MHCMRKASNKNIAVSIKDSLVLCLFAGVAETRRQHQESQTWHQEKKKYHALHFAASFLGPPVKITGCFSSSLLP